MVGDLLRIPLSLRQEKESKRIPFFVVQKECEPETPGRGGEGARRPGGAERPGDVRLAPTEVKRRTSV